MAIELLCAQTALCHNLNAFQIGCIAERNRASMRTLAICIKAAIDKDFAVNFFFVNHPTDIYRSAQSTIYCAPLTPRSQSQHTLLVRNMTNNGHGMFATATNRSHFLRFLNHITLSSGSRLQYAWSDACINTLFSLLGWDIHTRIDASQTCNIKMCYCVQSHIIQYFMGLFFSSLFFRWNSIKSLCEHMEWKDLQPCSYVINIFELSSFLVAAQRCVGPSRATPMNAFHYARSADPLTGNWRTNKREKANTSAAFRLFIICWARSHRYSASDAGTRISKRRTCQRIVTQAVWVFWPLHISLYIAAKPRPFDLNREKGVACAAETGIRIW